MILFTKAAGLPLELQIGPAHVLEREVDGCAALGVDSQRLIFRAREQAIEVLRFDARHEHWLFQNNLDLLPDRAFPVFPLFERSFHAGRTYFHLVRAGDWIYSVNP